VVMDVRMCGFVDLLICIVVKLYNRVVVDL